MTEEVKQEESRYERGMTYMFEVIRTLNRLTDDERNLYLKGVSYYSRTSMPMAECIEKYDAEKLKVAFEQYRTDNLELGDIFVRILDGLEYLVVKYESRNPGHRTYRCISLKNDKEFCLRSITEIRRTKKHMNIERLKEVLR